MTTLQLATADMESRKRNAADKALYRKIGQRTGDLFSKLRKGGYVQPETADAGGPLRWQTSRKG